MQSDNKVYIKIRKIQAMGQAPVPRYAHAACFFQKRYMAIYGGRNDYLMSETSKFMLNDLHLYDIRMILGSYNMYRQQHLDPSCDVRMCI